MVIDEADRHVDAVDFYATTTSRFYAPVAVGIWLANWEIACDTEGLRGHLELASGQPSPARGASTQITLDARWVAGGC